MGHNWEKSMFLHREKDVWDCLATEEQLRAARERLREELATQLATTHQEVAELGPIRQELADLRIKYAEVRDDTREAGETPRPSQEYMYGRRGDRAATEGA